MLKGTKTAIRDPFALPIASSSCLRGGADGYTSIGLEFYPLTRAAYYRKHRCLTNSNAERFTL